MRTSEVMRGEHMKAVGVVAHERLDPSELVARDDAVAVVQRMNGIEIEDQLLVVREAPFRSYGP